MLLLFAGRCLERIRLAPHRIHTCHDMFDDAVFTRRVHALKNKQDRPLILGIKLALQVGKLFQALLQGRSGPLLRSNAASIGGIATVLAEMPAPLAAGCPPPLSPMFLRPTMVKQNIPASRLFRGTTT